MLFGVLVGVGGRRAWDAFVAPLALPVLPRVFEALLHLAGAALKALRLSLQILG
jgi:glucose-6-phosphate isomerase